MENPGQPLSLTAREKLSLVVRILIICKYIRTFEIGHTFGLTTPSPIFPNLLHSAKSFRVRQMVISCQKCSKSLPYGVNDG